MVNRQTRPGVVCTRFFHDSSSITQAPVFSPHLGHCTLLLMAVLKIETKMTFARFPRFPNVVSYFINRTLSLRNPVQ